MAQDQPQRERLTPNEAAPAADSQDDLLEGLSSDDLKKALQNSKNGSRPKRTIGNSASRPEGEDVGAERRVHPLALIGKQMKTIQTRMRAEDTSVGTQALQENVAEHLARLIDQLQQENGPSGQGRKEQQDQAGEAGGEQGSQPSNPSPNTGQKSNSLTSQATQPRKTTGEKTLNSQAAQSDERAGASPSGQYASQPPEALMKEVWGHLPERIRPKLPTSARIEKFLPKYERLIADYYERLAKERR